MEKNHKFENLISYLRGTQRATVEVMTLKRCNTLASLQALEKLWLALMLILLHTLENHVWAYLTGIFSIVVTSLDQDSCYTPKQNTSGEAVFINSSKIQLDLSFYYGHVNKFKASQVRIPIWSKLFKTDLKTLHIRHTCSFSLKPVCILSRLEENIFLWEKDWSQNTGADLGMKVPRCLFLRSKVLHTLTGKKTLLSECTLEYNQSDCRF